MEEYDVIVVGAGAAGLMAARELSRKNLKVIILEGRDRIGGRINTINNSDFATYVEAGAEFIHGNLPVTMELLREGNIPYKAVEGEMGRIEKGKLNTEETFIKDWPLIIEKLKALKKDISIQEFLDQNFSGKSNQAIRDSVIGFVEGYDAGDPSNSSSFALREEWLNENDYEQYRITGGYEKLITFLEKECKANKVVIQLSSTVKKIDWKNGIVEFKNEILHRLKGRRIIITVPLGVLKAEASDNAYISITPSIPEKISSLENLGFGSVIKILLQFKEAFWENLNQTKGHNKEKSDEQTSLKNIGFIFSNASVPTWWTQLPENIPLLTGWLAGPKAAKNDQSNDELLEDAIDSLSMIFNLPADFIKNKLDKWLIINWGKDPFTRGAYAYPTVNSIEAKRLLSIPVENVLYFAGEAYYNGPALGTVEAALLSGREAAAKILAVE